ncbi:S-layer homology domain-containing protein [Pseudalkalibacillus berkeleyi]|uniref:S-layer homology domain-containing protein n=1 Tax=Pseudalkalibacillus berkeleyi TaxID=1069813 RepID=A0ABS9H4D9_9BACL|nr:S-layer homology domain-containing protein [Pseudalkalibacillus berkeleyi]MCF6138786.1 S-layer homology domain-containing protein [Pseudalkalibacillus berkeleyi]
MKKFIASLSAVLLSASILSPLSAEASLDNYYADDLDEHWAADTMYQLIDADIIKGYMNAGVMTAKPNQNITRAEVTTLLVRSLDLKKSGSGKTFLDVKSDKWYYDAIQIASSLGIVNGKTKTTFEPNKHITREELATMIVRAFEQVSTIDFTNGQPINFTDKNTFSTWAVPYINKASAVELIQGYNGKFSPKNTATRAETSTMLLNALHSESTDLPSADALFSAIERNESEMLNLYKKNEFQSAFSIIDKNTIGFYNALLTFSNDYYIDAKDFGVTFDFAKVGEAKFELLDRNTRLAVVELSGLSYYVTETYEGESETKNNDTTSGTYFLRKIDGDWKIYAQY